MTSKSNNHWNDCKKGIFILFLFVFVLCCIDILFEIFTYFTLKNQVNNYLERNQSRKEVDPLE